MYGVVNGVYYCNNDRVDELNDRISERNIPSQKLQSQFDIRPVSSKYAMMPIFDRRAIPTVPIERMPTYDLANTFNPGNAQAPWSGFCNNVNTESQLRNQFFALQKCEQSEFVPSSTSDLYQTKINYTPQQQTHPMLFDKPDLAPFNPNVHNLGNSLFNNHTRYQLKDTSDVK